MILFVFRMLSFYFTLTLSGCVDNILESEKIAVFQVDGPISIDSTVYGTPDFPYLKYSIDIKEIKRNIYIETSYNSNIYTPFSIHFFTNKDLIPIASVSKDFVASDTIMLGKGSHYSFDFYLQPYDFDADLMELWFKYFLDSSLEEGAKIVVQHQNFRIR